jgi:hypothetical protein
MYIWEAFPIQCIWFKMHAICIHHVTYATPSARNAQRKDIHMLQRSSHTPNSRNQTHTKLPPANEWKLLDLGIWWKYRLVGHVWVHGSKLSFLSLRCLSENDTSLVCVWFWNGALGSLQRLWHWCYHIEVGHGYTPHQSHSWCMWSKGAESNN